MREFVMALREQDGAPSIFRRSITSSWQQERRQWHVLNDPPKEVPSDGRRTTASSLCGAGGGGGGGAPPVLRILRSTHKTAFSQRQRLRKAGELVEPQLNSFDLSPPMSHSTKPNVTFSKRQRLRKRGLLNKSFSSSEDEVFDSLEQLFPGARADYPSSSQSIIASFADDELRRRRNTVAEFLADYDDTRNGESGWDKDREADAESTPGEEAEEEAAAEEEEEEEEGEAQGSGRTRTLRFKLKLGPSGRRLLSGAIAGAFSRTAVAPLETIRTHLMVGSHGHSVSQVFHWIMSNEGWPGLFRGNTINVIRVAPSKAIELFAYDSVKAFLSPKDGKPGKLAFLPVSPIAGSCAGISSTICMYPLELLKTRLTIQPGEYRGILHALWRIVSEEGILELYRGLGPSVIGVIPYAGVNYFAYDSLRSLYKRWSKTDRVGNIQTLLIGSLAGVIASTSTFPLEVARKHMQVGALKGRVVYKGTLDALRGIVKERGIKGLYIGLGPSCLKLMPAAGLSFMCYEALKRILLEEEQV
ncbi:unnamed protein product [Sphagnum jensenii]|uniref:Mitochondrial carrier protein n=1 Tax=Sphagnum jensenii TaxID=128206 RepID=A0ABP0X5I3_9BRYO